MKYTYYILAVLILLTVSCSNRKHPSEYFPQSTPSYDSLTEPVRSDTVKQEKPAQQPSHSTSSLQAERQRSSASSSSHYDDDELDNMRGFDPASEDDMDDNGISRYMENDDDEGWD